MSTRPGQAPPQGVNAGPQWKGARPSSLGQHYRPTTLAAQKGMHRSPKASGLKFLGWVLCTTEIGEDQTIEYYQQAQRGRERRTTYLVERSTKGLMIYLSVSDSAKRVTDTGANTDAAGPEAGEAPPVALAAPVSSMLQSLVAPHPWARTLQEVPGTQGAQPPRR
jgi:hypothetical protein